MTKNISTTIKATATAQSSKENEVEKGFVVWTPSCRIPDLDPFDPDTMKFFRQRNSIIIYNTYILGTIRLIEYKI